MEVQGGLQSYSSGTNGAARHRLLVEVVSPRTRKTDRFTKPAEYASAGVPLFWRLETDPLLALHPGDFGRALDSHLFDL